MVSVEAEQTFDFLDTLPVNKDSLPKSTIVELKEFAIVSKDEGGLLPRAACPEVFSVSRQRFDQIEKQVGFKRFEFMGMIWFSRKELEAYYKLEKKKGRPKKGTPSLRKIVSDCFEDARKEA